MQPYSLQNWLEIYRMMRSADRIRPIEYARMIANRKKKKGGKKK